MAPGHSCTYHSQRNILVVEIWCVTFPGSLESGNTSPLRNVLELKGPIQRASRPHKEKARAWLNLILINIPCKLATGTACFVHLFYHERRWSSSQHEHKSQAIFCTPARCWHLPSVLCNRVFSFRANGSECYFWNYSVTSDYNVKLSLEPAAGLGLWVEIFVIWNMIEFRREWTLHFGRWPEERTNPAKELTQKRNSAIRSSTFSFRKPTCDVKLTKTVKSFSWGKNIGHCKSFGALAEILSRFPHRGHLPWWCPRLRHPWANRTSFSLPSPLSPPASARKHESLRNMQIDSIYELSHCMNLSPFHSPPPERRQQFCWTSNFVISWCKIWSFGVFRTPAFFHVL